jgi:hypothetical protein
MSAMGGKYALSAFFHHLARLTRGTHSAVESVGLLHALDAFLGRVPIQLAATTFIPLGNPTRLQIAKLAYQLLTLLTPLVTVHCSSPGPRTGDSTIDLGVLLFRRKLRPKRGEEEGRWQERFRKLARPSMGETGEHRHAKDQAT